MHTTHHGHRDDDPALRAWRASVVRLHQLTRGLDDEQLEQRSYCAEWSVADVLSHLGSGAVIWLRQLEDALAGRTTPENFAPSVWGEWDAKSARAKADDALVVDERLVERFESQGDEVRASLVVPMGPMRFSFGEAVAMRVNEHALHTWDIEVVFDDGAHLPADAAGVVVDNLGLIVRFTGRPPRIERRLSLRTTHPARDFTLRLGPEGVELEPGAGTGDPDLELPAEALCRLVYGRLDPGHRAEVRGEPGLLELLRAVFPGP